jgi:hypothetical protein
MWTWWISFKTTHCAGWGSFLSNMKKQPRSITCNDSAILRKKVPEEMTTFFFISAFLDG